TAKTMSVFMQAFPWLSARGRLSLTPTLKSCDLLFEVARVSFRLRQKPRISSRLQGKLELGILNRLRGERVRVKESAWHHPRAGSRARGQDIPIGEWRTFD